MNKLAIVTGGGRGIGAATCIALANAGYDICVNYATDQESAETTAEKCRELGAGALTIKADVSDSNAVQAMFDQCDAAFGAPALLVNNAGIIGAASTVADLTPQTLQKTYAVNVFGAFYCAREAIKRMGKDNGGTGGVIVNISSIAATNGSPNEYVHYASSKAAIDGFTIGLSKEVGPQGIRVCSVQAGTVDTDIHAKTGNPERPAMVAATSPLRRVGEPQDIAQAVVWLASNRAKYATGTILRVGGGL